MDASELEPLIARLVSNPHDEDALAYAHSRGEADPKAYATFLERLGNDTPDPAYAAHWLAEAAHVWATTLADAHRAAHVLMAAIERDPTHQVAAKRLADLYREKGDVKALAALLDHRAKAIAPLASEPSVAQELSIMHEELAQLYADPAALAQPNKAIEHWRKAAELDPQNAFAIFNARELLKGAERYEEAVPLYAAELALETDPERRLALLRDEANTRRLVGDLAGVTQTLQQARAIDPDDPVLRQEMASSVLDRVQAGAEVDNAERNDAVLALTSLALEFGGEHALAYGAAALDIDPGADDALSAFRVAAQASGQDDLLADRYRAYLATNPSGAWADEARTVVGDVETSSFDRSLAPDSVPDARPADAPVGSDLDALVAELGGEPEPEPELAPPPVEEEDDDPLAALLGPSPRQSAPASVAEPRSAAPASLAAAAAAIPAEPNKQRPRGPVGPDRLQGILDAARMLAGKHKKDEALAKYKDVLETEPAHPEALAWVEDYLRSQRNYGELRDVLLASVSALGSQESIESKKERLREVAGLCEGNLRDTDGAIAAWRQLIALDRSDESARTALTRLLERTQRWDDLANLLEQEATVASDLEVKIVLEKKLAKLQEDRRKDLIGAAEAWVRIARLTPDEDGPVSTAAKLYERAGRVDLAAGILSEHAPRVDDPMARGALLERLGQLRENLEESEPAGDAYAEAADLLRNARLWDEAERVFAASNHFVKAANAAEQRGQLANDAKQKAQALVRAADYFTRDGQEDLALEKLETATNLDPLNDDYADQLGKRFSARGEHERLVHFLSKRGDRLSDRQKRIATRRHAAQLAAKHLHDPEFSRELWLKMLEDGDDREALERLIDDATGRGDHTEATTLLRRLAQGTADKAERARVVLREADLLANGVGDVDTALARYDEILLELEPTSRPALQAIADLQERRGEIPAATDALERELKLVADVAERGQIAGRLARLYETQGDTRSAIRALELVRKADPEDYDALARLCELCEAIEQWDRVAELLAERIEVEGDEEEAATMTKRLAEILADKLDRGDEALAALTELADGGSATVRQAYVELGDKLGWKGIVAQKLVEWWFDARHTPERQEALTNAFHRFVDVGHDQEAVRVAIELVRTRSADRGIAEQLETLAVKITDPDALTVAHDMLAREYSGADRGRELVRQAEVKVKAGVSKESAFEYGEEGLSLLPAGSDEHIDRVAALAPKAADVVDLYERQVSRAKAPGDRARALARAAQIAVAKGQPERARTMYELALAGSPEDEVIEMLEDSAKSGDAEHGGDKLRRTLANALAAGGQGARDGGKTRAALLRRAALFVVGNLEDADQAFRWLGESLVTHVDPITLDELEKLGAAVSDERRTEHVLSHALGEVFDGPLVRQLLSRRARLRLGPLDDKLGAAADLKKLHDLSPNDASTLIELANLFIGLGDYKSLVALYEDQILRGREVSARAEYARKVARIWEEQLQDARESADAWRRVLRMKAGDEEATVGLERAKAQKLKTADANPTEHYAPPVTSTGASTPPARKAESMPAKRPASAAPQPPTPARASAGPPAAPRVPSVPPPAEVDDDTQAIDRQELSSAASHGLAALEDTLRGPKSEASVEAPKDAPKESVRPATRPQLRRTPANPFGDGSSVLDQEIAASLEMLGDPRPSAAPPAPPSEPLELNGTTAEVDVDDIEEVDDGELVDDAELLEVVDDDEQP